MSGPRFRAGTCFLVQGLSQFLKKAYPFKEMYAYIYIYILNTHGNQIKEPNLQVLAGGFRACRVDWLGLSEVGMWNEIGKIIWCAGCCIECLWL